MADQIRLVTIKRGYDPREFALVVLGGAGPVHGVALAEEMGMAEVIVPEAPGVLAAFGLLAAAIEHHHARTLPGRADAIDLDGGERLPRRARRRGPRAHGRGRRAARRTCRWRTRRTCATSGRRTSSRCRSTAPLAPGRHRGRRARVPRGPRARVRLCARRPAGRVRELPRRAPLPAACAEACGRPRAPRAGSARRASASAARTSRPAASSRTPIYDRARLPLGSSVPGPAIVEQADTTTVIPPGYAAAVDPSGNLRIRRTRMSDPSPSIPSSWKCCATGSRPSPTRWS